MGEVLGLLDFAMIDARLRSVGDKLDTATGARVQVEVGGARFIRADVSRFETALVTMAVDARDATVHGGRSEGCGVRIRSLGAGTGFEPVTFRL